MADTQLKVREPRTPFTTVGCAGVGNDLQLVRLTK